jgi:hypothetical protein
MSLFRLNENARFAPLSKCSGSSADRLEAVVERASFGRQANVGLTSKSPFGRQLAKAAFHLPVQTPAHE